MQEKPKHGAELCDEITQRVDLALAQNDFEWCLQDRLQAGELSPAEAEEARAAFDNWIETGASGLTYDPNQGVLFDAEG